MSKSKYRQIKHAFRFKMGGGKIVTIWVKVVNATKDVYLPLKAAHVKESIRLRGAGNTQTCSMAVCARREADCFPHDVEGYIDWLYSRAFVVSRRDKNGLPSECICYAHSDGIARLNDTPGGQKQLLEELEAEGGERIIHLRPPPPSMKRPGLPRGRKDGSRTRVQPRGAKLRYAVSLGGAVG